MTFGKDKISFLQLPTPLERLDNLSKELGVNFYLKRDDMTSIGGGGNKLRKLEYFVAEAQRQNATTLLTVGGAQTNHGRLTAAVAAKYGFKSAIVTTDDYPGETSANLLLDGFLGCSVYFKPMFKLSEAVEIVKNELESAGEKVYFIPLGGSDALGALGYYDCGIEVAEQLRAIGLMRPYVFVTAGSLGTYLGLEFARLNRRLSFDLTGISVLPRHGTAAEYAEKLFGEIYKTYMGTLGFNIDVPPRASQMEINENYIFGAYNNAVHEVREAIYLMARKEGIFLDPCYTGKTFYGILDMINRGEIEKNSDVVMIHTGGFPGNYAAHHRIEMENELIEFMKIDRVI